ncbi:hypothetical protein KI387_009052, partial [Taxus chinensis]
CENEAVLPKISVPKTFFWPAIVMKKWLNIKPRKDEFGADERDTESDFDDEEANFLENEPASKSGINQTVSHFQVTGTPSEHFLRRLKRGKSETMRAQYIDAKEIKILVGTWNVGGKLPLDDLDIEEWLSTKDPADLNYSLGEAKVSIQALIDRDVDLCSFQELVPLNVGNIFGAEDNIPVYKWENRLRSTLNKVQPAELECKCYSSPPSPSRANASDAIADEILSGRDVVSDVDVSISPQSVEADTPVDPANDLIYLSNLYNFKRVSRSLGRSQATWPEELLEAQHPKSNVNLWMVFSEFGRIGLGCTETLSDLETQALPYRAKLGRVYSMSEKIGLSWPEQPLDLETEDLLPNI